MMRPMRVFVGSVIRLVGTDMPLVLGILVRVWGMAAGVVTLTFVTHNLSPQLQGYYFTFGSLGQLTALVDLGLQVLVLQFASHEAAHLVFGRQGAISGPLRSVERLVSLARFSIAWFGIFSVVLIPMMFGIGHWLFAGKTDAPDWQNPWLLLCVLVGLDLILNNFVWLLEGTNQLRLNYSYRLLRGIVTPLTVWICLELGWGLIAIPMGVLTGIITLVAFLAFTSRAFVMTMLRVKPREHRLSWRREIMPLQWRLSVSQITGFAAYSLFVPVTFKLVGPVEAGQMGLSWTLVDAMTSVALLWFSVKFPSMGAMAARREWKALDRVSLRSGLLCAAIATLGATTIVGLTWVLHISGSHYAVRFLSLPALTILAYGAVSKTVSATIILYMRAHREEPIAFLTMVMAPLMAGAVVMGAIWFGATGVAGGYFLVMTFYMVPGAYIIMRRSRTHWQAAG